MLGERFGEAESDIDICVANGVHRGEVITYLRQQGYRRAEVSGRPELLEDIAVEPLPLLGLGSDRDGWPVRPEERYASLSYAVAVLTYVHSSSKRKINIIQVHPSFPLRSVTTGFDFSFVACR